MTCFSRQDGNDVAVTCESAVPTETCGLTITTLRGEAKKGGKTISLTRTTPVRNADCSVQGIECMKMTLTMNGSAAATGNGIRRFCTAGSDSSFTVSASRTSSLSVDRNQDLDRNGTPELLWQNLPAGRFNAWYMDGKNMLTEKYIYATRDRLVAAADFNSDGKSDLLLQSGGGTGLVIVMQKNGAFKSENRVIQGNIEGYWAIVGAGDFDGDGYPDVVLYNRTDGRIIVYYWDGLHFVNARQIGRVDSLAWRAVGVGDFDFDNRPDILLHNEVTGEISVWHMNDTDVVGVTPVENANPVWHVHAVCDMNGDGHPDIVWRNNSTGDVVIWYMNRTRRVVSDVFTTVRDHNLQLASGLAYTGSSYSTIYNRVLWRHQVSGWLAIWLISGTTYQSISYIMDAQAAPSLKDPGWVVAATGDLDGDRLDDILWQNQATGKTAVWFMKDDAVAGSREMATVADTNWTIAATGDFDGDGQTDILLHNPSTGGLRLWLMNGTSSVRQVSLGGVAKGWRVGGISLAGIGKVNIYFQEIATGRVVVWHMTGMHRDSSRAVSTPGDKNWVLVSVRQFAVDGILDLVVHNEATGEVAVWLMRDSETVWTVRSIGIAADRNWKLEGVYF